MKRGADMRIGKKIARKMIEITRDMSNTLCNIANKLEDEFLE